jgi:hypothetical protein
MKKNFLLVNIAVFLFLIAVFYGVKRYAPDYNFVLLMSGNMLMFILSLASHAIINTNIKGRPEAFVRGVYMSTFLKIMVCMAAVLLYVFINREHLHKPSIIALMGVYIIYSIVDTTYSSRVARQAK